jgi:sterol desaturase/sphingolipid hydroxylase (fatty acid hydroxylase superfamily)
MDAHERALARLAVRTPHTHRIHHSDQPAHYNSNFGVILSV